MKLLGVAFMLAVIVFYFEYTANACCLVPSKLKCIENGCNVFCCKCSNKTCSEKSETAEILYDHPRDRQRYKRSPWSFFDQFSETNAKSYIFMSSDYGEAIGAATLSRMVRDADLNKDGKLSLEEKEDPRVPKSDEVLKKHNATNTKF